MTSIAGKACGSYVRTENAVPSHEDSSTYTGGAKVATRRDPTLTKRSTVRASRCL